MMTGGYQVPGHGSGDDGFEEEGYDESQRAEILEVTGDGPTDGLLLTDLPPDIVTDGDDEDDLDLEDDELGEDDDEDGADEDDDDEDDLQDDLDEDDVDPDSLSDRDDAALRP